MLPALQDLRLRRPAGVHHLLRRQAAGRRLVLLVPLVGRRRLVLLVPQ